MPLTLGFAEGEQILSFLNFEDEGDSEDLGYLSDSSLDLESFADDELYEDDFSSFEGPAGQDASNSPVAEDETPVLTEAEEEDDDDDEEGEEHLSVSYQEGLLTVKTLTAQLLNRDEMELLKLASTRPYQPQGSTASVIRDEQAYLPMFSASVDVGFPKAPMVQLQDLDDPPEVEYLVEGLFASKEFQDLSSDDESIWGLAYASSDDEEGYFEGAYEFSSSAEDGSDLESQGEDEEEDDDDEEEGSEEGSEEEDEGEGEGEGEGPFRGPSPGALTPPPSSEEGADSDIDIEGLDGSEPLAPFSLPPRSPLKRSRDPHHAHEPSPKRQAREKQCAHTITFSPVREAPSQLEANLMMRIQHLLPSEHLPAFLQMVSKFPRNSSCFIPSASKLASDHYVIDLVSLSSGNLKATDHYVQQKIVGRSSPQTLDFRQQRQRRPASAPASPLPSPAPSPAPAPCQLPDPATLSPPATPREAAKPQSRRGASSSKPLRSPPRSPQGASPLRLAHSKPPGRTIDAAPAAPPRSFSSPAASEEDDEVDILGI